MPSANCEFVTASVYTKSELLMPQFVEDGRNKMTGYPGMRTCGKLMAEGHGGYFVSRNCWAAGSKLMGINCSQVDKLEENEMMTETASLLIGYF